MREFFEFIMDDDDEEIGDENAKCKVCIAGSKKVATFVLSHVGLISLVVGYCLIGAVIFEALESEHERQVHIFLDQLFIERSSQPQLL